MIINDRQISSSYKKVNVSDLAYYQLNPRVNLHFKKLGRDPSTISMNDIHNHMSTTSSVKVIIDGFKKSKYKYTGEEQVVVPSENLSWANSFGKKYIVIEGNSRLRFFHHIDENDEYDQSVKDKFKTLQVEVIHEKVSEEEVDAYLSMVHVTAKTAWAKEAQAFHLYSRIEKANIKKIQDRAVLIEKFAKEVKRPSKVVEKDINAFEMLYKENDLNGNHFEHYRQLVSKMPKMVESSFNNSSGSYKKDDVSPELRKTLDLVQDNEITSTNIRDRLAVLYDNKKHLFNKVINKSKDLKTAYKIYETSLGPHGAQESISEFNQVLDTDNLDIDICESENDVKNGIWNTLESVIMKSIKLYNKICIDMDRKNKCRSSLKEHEVKKLRETISKLQKKKN